jgi:hypothetical protein
MNLHIDGAPLVRKRTLTLPLTNLSSHIQLPLRKYPIPPLHLVYEDFTSSTCSF